MASFQKKIGDLFVRNSYIEKLYIKFTITTSTFDVKFKENNENDMTFVVWAGTVFGPRLWQLSVRRRLLADIIVKKRIYRAMLL